MGDHAFVIDIAAPRETVFDLWMDVGRMPEWTEGLTRVTDVRGALGRAGTRYSAWFGRSRADVEILVGDRPHRVGWRVRIGPLAAEIHAVFDDAVGGTRMTETVRTRGFIAGAWARILATGGYRGSFRGELRHFAAICERDAM